MFTVNKIVLYSVDETFVHGIEETLKKYKDFKKYFVEITLMKNLKFSRKSAKNMPMTKNMLKN